MAFAPMAASAAPSNGCSNINLGLLDYSTDQNAGSSGEVAQSFTAGEVVTATFARISGNYSPAYFQMAATASTNYSAQQPHPGNGAVLTLTIQANTTDVKSRMSNTGGSAGTGSVRVTHSCAAVQASTSTSIISSTNPSTFHQSVTFKATVTPAGTDAPYGNVNFTDGATSLGSASLVTVTQSRLTVRGSHSCTIDSGGGVACWGNNFYGELGSGDTTPYPSPRAVGGLTGISAIAAGESYTCAITSGGGISCWGYNNVGQLGSGDTTQYKLPHPVSGFTGAVGIAAGTRHTCVITTGGGVSCWGYNNVGQLGSGDTTPYTSPHAISGLTGVVALAAGLEHTCAITSGGGMACWGGNQYGQLGAGNTTGSLTPQPIAGLTGVTAIATGDAHTCAVASGLLSCWGRNDSGQVGSGDTAPFTSPHRVSGLSAVTAVTGGQYHTCAVSSGGALSCWGSNAFGQLGSGDTTQYNSPHSVGGLATISTVAAGTTHTCALTTGGGVPCWGFNAEGELGNGTTTDSSSPIFASGFPLYATASLTTLAVVGGVRTIKASYDGDFNTSASFGTVVQTVNPATTTTTISANPVTTTYGQSVTFTATVASAAGTPTGNATFTIDGTPQTAAALVNGVLTLSRSNLAAGAHTVSAAYAGDGNFDVSSGSLAGGLTVTMAPTVTSLASSPAISAAGQSIIFTATVSKTAPGTLGGSVTFKDGVTTLGSGTISSGLATFATTALSVGTHSIVAVYSGDASFAMSTSGTLMQTVKAVASSVVLTSSLNPSVFGASLTLSASFASTQATGIVTFRDGTTVLGTVPVSGGVASFTTTTLSPGGHRLTASYPGDANTTASTSADLLQTVLLSCQDAFATATPLPGRSGTASGNTIGAIGESNEPNHAGNSTPLNSVWCKWTAPLAGPVTLDTTGSSFDTTLAVYTGNSLGALVAVASNDNIAANTVQSRVTFTATQGVTYMIALDGAGSAAGNYLLNFTQAPAQPKLAAAILPTARSVQTSGFATAFATLMNTGAATATQCSMALPPFYPAMFTYQTTNAHNALIGTPDTPVDIPAGGAQTFVFGILPMVELNSADVALVFSCSNTEAALTVAGVDTLSISSSATPPPDLVAIGATTSNDGIVTVPTKGQAFFSAAAINIGAAGTITATIDDNNRSLPLTITLCESNATGACINPPTAGALTTRSLSSNGIVTYSIFVSANAAVPFDPANSRLFLRLKTPDNVTRGATSVAVRTQ